MQNLFSYPIIIDELNAAEKKYHLKAEAKDLAYLTDALKVPAVKSLEADFFLKLNKKEHFLEVSGSVKAELELQSVISLDYFTKAYTSEFKLNYDTKAKYEDIKELDEDIEDDIPDIIIDGKIDLVDIAIEQIALVLEDHPRKDGEKFEFKPSFDPNEPIRENPFNVLKKLKK